MTTQTNFQTYKFIKGDSGKWYIDLPDWTGQKADLEMVGGADTMLDHVGSGAPEAELILSEFPFANADVLELIHDYSRQPGGGGIYFLGNYNGEILNQEIWLCEVTEFVFGKLPPQIYLKKV
ncbi:DUF6717 family protein [Mucilaginibacter sp. L3T2-6]|uniref:DUF6717 family protein n=1 Tax=Mucilaginibacter sp. L3T2-6 TaxID=3062491 RepID=UPI002674FD08|nr:DUF6717 family protein [Mucilaginibacter sp. L3T2-6]MDO3643121.1 hypothetical protein [Mucilaginibacter sp. L3T2-6]MDV6215888.1 DUF6717 family protein [Mucilaginibacter sp. L3T2-6]